MLVKAGLSLQLQKLTTAIHTSETRSKTVDCTTACDITSRSDATSDSCTGTQLVSCCEVPDAKIPRRSPRSEEMHQLPDLTRHVAMSLSRQLCPTPPPASSNSCLCLLTACAFLFLPQLTFGIRWLFYGPAVMWHTHCMYSKVTYQQLQQRLMRLWFLFLTLLVFKKTYTCVQTMMRQMCESNVHDVIMYRTVKY